jgi:hypothetical protein
MRAPTGIIEAIARLRDETLANPRLAALLMLVPLVLVIHVGLLTRDALEDARSAATRSRAAPPALKRWPQAVAGRRQLAVRKPRSPGGSRKPGARVPRISPRRICKPRCAR